MTYKHLLTAALLTSASFFSVQPAFAGDLATESPDHVVELFTSQGCSSCPPANKFVSGLADDEGLLALTYGVTYWDYLGWKDTFAKPEFTKRQRAYGAAFDTGNVYTPQIVLNGASHSPRYSKRDIASMDLKTDRPRISLSTENGDLGFALDQGNAYKFLVVTYKPGKQEVPVKRGENGGRTLALSNVVTAIKPVTGPGDTNVKIEAGLNYAVLAHDPQTAKIVTAAVYKSQ